MSPVSQGNLEIERYIGSYLISSVRGNSNKSLPVKNGNHTGKGKKSSANGESAAISYRPGLTFCPGWAGVPLISMSSSERRTNKQISEEHPDISRLALHTQGAPIIVGRNYGKSTGANINNFTSTRRTQPSNDGKQGTSTRKHNPRFNQRQNVTLNKSSGKPSSDSVSVTSEESSATSETSLPRIIKPRKRRKKERKPQANIVVEKPNPVLKSTTIPPPKEKIQEEIPLSACQCRYCDPAGLIWDVEEHRFSPFLTRPCLPLLLPIPLSLKSPSSQKTKLQLKDSEPEISKIDLNSETVKETHPKSQNLEVSTEIVTSLNGHRDIEIKFYSTSSNKKDISQSQDINKQATLFISDVDSVSTTFNSLLSPDNIWESTYLNTSLWTDHEKYSESVIKYFDQVEE